ncbi:MAG: GNAT family N-acetyltransferase [Candidatus Omnitrophica bacterium]|nr:GNAT family N-acetyltransferase [Candidatus Omnitrophota bacterium]
MKIRLARRDDRAEWDNYVDRLPLQPPLNRYGWKNVLEKSYGIKTLFFIASDERDNICGVLPTYIIRDFRGKKRLYSLRFGLSGNNDTVRNEFFLYLKSFCKKNNFISNSVTSGYCRVDTEFRCFIKKTIMMEIADNEEATWGSFRAKTRNMIRKALRSNLTSEKGFHNLKEFYNIYMINMLAKGIPVHSYRFFRNLVSEIRDAELIVAKMDGRIIAGILILFSKDIAIYPFQASLMHFHKFAPNNFLIWEAIKSCLKRGIHRLDMGESTEGGDVYIFKTNLGGSPRDIYYYSAFGPKRVVVDEIDGETMTLPLTNKILLNTPFWLKKRMGLWIKKRERII